MATNHTNSTVRTTRAVSFRRKPMILGVLAGLMTLVAVGPALADHDDDNRRSRRRARTSQRVVEGSCGVPDRPRRGRETLDFGSWSFNIGHGNPNQVRPVWGRKAGPNPRARGFRDGRRDGWQDGYSAGLSRGGRYGVPRSRVGRAPRPYRRGYEEGYSVAYEAGFNEGRRQRVASRRNFRDHRWVSRW